MTPNPFSGLIHSRKFWLLILDTVVSLVATVGAWYLAPEALNQVIAILAIMQPLYIFVITSITKEDVAKIDADVQIKAIQATVASTKADVQIQEMKSSDIADIIKK